MRGRRCRSTRAGVLLVLVAAGLTACTETEDPVRRSIEIPAEAMVEDVVVTADLELAEMPAFSTFDQEVTNRTGEAIWLLPDRQGLVPDVTTDRGVVLTNGVSAGDSGGDGAQPAMLTLTPLADGESLQQRTRFAADFERREEIPDSPASIRLCVAFVRDAAVREYYDDEEIDPAEGPHDVGQVFAHLHQEYACTEPEPLG